MIVSIVFGGEENRVYCFRLAALFPIQCEVPAVTRSDFRALVYQPQVTVPLNTKHCIVVFLFENAFLEQEQAATSQTVTRRTQQSLKRHRIIHPYVW